MDECTKGSPRDSRSVHDTNAVFETLKMIDNNISEHSIRDCQRLGKYSDTKRHIVHWTLQLNITECGSVLDKYRVQ